MSVFGVVGVYLQVAVKEGICGFRLNDIAARLVTKISHDIVGMKSF